MTATSFDTLFNEVASEMGASVLHKGHARSALRYASFNLTDIDNPELAKKIIRKALSNAEDSHGQKAEKTALSVQDLMSTKKQEAGVHCPRCKSASPMQKTELLHNVAAFYCPTCRLTDVAS